MVTENEYHTRLKKRLKERIMRGRKNWVMGWTIVFENTTTALNKRIQPTGHYPNNPVP